jgi:hypothetical protein
MEKWDLHRRIARLTLDRAGVSPTADRAGDDDCHRFSVDVGILHRHTFMMLSICLSVLVLVAERSWGEQTGD